MSFLEVRKHVYTYHIDYYDYVFKWPWYSYRRYKTIFYLELTSILVFLLLKTGISPNAVTVCYIFVSIFTGVLLALPLRSTVVIAAVLMLVKPVMDWVDGPLARIREATSVSGDLLDNYSALVSWIVLMGSVGIYLGNSMHPLFYYLAPILPMIFAADIYSNVRERLIYHYLTNKEARKADAKAAVGEKDGIGNESLVRNVKKFIDSLFEYNVRTVDLVCLAILVESFSRVKILWVFYSVFLAWQILTFFFKIYAIGKRGWAGDELDRLRKALYE